ncbi:MAG: ATP-binding protein [Candidatus Paracaedibacter sp.]
MKRIYTEIIEHHFAVNRQALFLSGPLQVGKTTIAREYLKTRPRSLYLNWDNLDHRKVILQGPRSVADTLLPPTLSEDKSFLCFDEIHKFKEWKTFLKGFIDTYYEDIQVLVTGSARLDVFSKSGDSLMGRYFMYRVHPLSVGELLRPTRSYDKVLIHPPQKIRDAQFNALLKFGGFPDPFLRNEQNYYHQWQGLRHRQFFQDIRDLATIQDIALMEVLADILKYQVGQLTNYSSLATKVRVSDPTIRRWIKTFESLYYCFTLQPWSTNVPRSLLKEPKYYLWDWSLVPDKGAQAENFIASHLLKAVQFWTDSGLGDFRLAYLRTKDKREVDFLVTKDQKPWIMIEVKASGKEALSPNLHHFQQQLGAPHVFQVALDLPYVDKDCFSLTRPTIVPAKTFLSQLV